jgi:hypothetical protein
VPKWDDVSRRDKLEGIGLLVLFILSLLIGGWIGLVVAVLAIVLATMVSAVRFGITEGIKARRKTHDIALEAGVLETEDLQTLERMFEDYGK